jgi:deoxyribodipyrimidine photo-lyase
LKNIFWFRRDLRIQDNCGLYHALQSGKDIVPIFIFDKNILDKIERKNDARVTFLYDTVTALQQELRSSGSDLCIFYDTPENVFRELLKEYAVSTVFCNTDYESYAVQRDRQIRDICDQHGVSFSEHKDHVIFHRDEVVKDDGKPYTVFTPYKKKWLLAYQALSANQKHFASETFVGNFWKTDGVLPGITLEKMGFNRSDIPIPPKEVARGIIRHYDETRDFPAIQGTSKLGIHFRFGTVSIREKAKAAAVLNETYLSELIWRDFYAMILFHFPHVEKEAFRREYDQIEWENDEKKFKSWCEGKTGYPMVDAGMRELKTTGYMHNRVRMITASFLTKHLLIDWRWGESWFAQHLLDFDLASNNGGWQWAAGCGTDAAPYFRIFNPEAQQQKFDKNFVYIKKWVPEFGTPTYVTPIVDHPTARQKCLETYKKALDKS